MHIQSLNAIDVHIVEKSLENCKIQKHVKFLKMVKFKGHTSSKRLVDSNHIQTLYVIHWCKVMSKFNALAAQIVEKSPENCKIP
jgi:hypothetical protein